MLTIIYQKINNFFCDAWVELFSDVNKLIIILNANDYYKFNRVKNAIRNGVPVDPSLDKGKWLKLEQDKRKQDQAVNSNPSLITPISWQEFPSANLPKLFDESSIYDYLISSCIVEKENLNYSDEDDENEPSIIDYSTAKPLNRGKLYVDSNRVTNIFDSLTSQNIYCLKSTVKASYQVKTSYNVQVMVNSETGKILRGTCECKASSLGRCAHVAALLHILLIQCKDNAKQDISCTSQLCSWNQGSKKKEAHKVDHQYNQADNENNEVNNSKNDIVDDNRNSQLEIQKTLYFARDLQILHRNNKHPSIWELVITPSYDDYELDLPRKAILCSLVYQLTASLFNFKDKPRDLTGGVQSASDNWWMFRKILITASKVKYFSLKRTDEQICTWIKYHLWIDKNFDNVALQYGRDNEEVAKKKYTDFTSKKFGFQISDCGIWVNPKFPGIGASPDGLVTDGPNNTHGLLEIKCPKILEHLGPTDLHLLTPRQRSSFCCALLNPKSMKLKRNHQYYFQIQTQMAITERKWCDFVIWTSKAYHVERIKYDANFIEPLLKHISNFHQNVLAPEYFEMRIPRDLKPFNLKPKKS